jgi:predicted SpoU family rRNA methylase
LNVAFPDDAHVPHGFNGRFPQHVVLVVAQSLGANKIFLKQNNKKAPKQVNQSIRLHVP